MRPFLACLPLAIVMLPGGMRAQVQGAAPPAVSGTPVPAPVSVRSDAQAAAASPEELVSRAQQALAGRKFSEAQALLDQAAALNPQQPGLWATYGALHARRGDVSTAIADYRKELAGHPDARDAYGALAALQASHGQPDAAATTLRSWATAEPGDPEAVIALVQLLLQGGKTAEAAREAHTGLAHLPPAVQGEGELQVTVGEAELRAGERKEAEVTLAAVLRGGTAGDSARNSAAYLLADEGLDLPLAETSQRMVVDGLSLRSEGWTLNEDIRMLRAQTTLLAACWDTLGWILFREGKAAEAEPLVRAAWRNIGHSGIAQHLGEIEAARGDHRAAVANFELALTAAHAEADTSQRGSAAAAPSESAAMKPDAPTVPGPSTTSDAPTSAEAGMQGSPEIDAIATQLRAERAAHPGLPASPSAADGRAALQRLSTFHLGNAGGRTGTGLYRILLQRGHVVRAAQLVQDAKTVPGGAELISHADFSAFFPETAGYTQLVHGGTLRCGGAQGCELQLEF